MDLTPQNIQLHIEELVVQGFEMPHRRDRLHASVQQELTRLFTEQGIPPALNSGKQLPQMNGGSFNLAPGVKTEALGAQIAQSIYTGLSQPS